LRPEWNGRPERQSETQRVEDGDDAALDTEASEEAMASGTPSTISEIPVTASDPLAPLATFEFTLQLTYWSQGFFNTGVAPSESFGADGDTIEIFFGDATSPILGTINRRSNNNGTPRIFGGSALRKMFQTQPVRAVMGVEVNSPTSIRIHPKVA
jgi:hypothetical protein